MPGSSSSMKARTRARAAGENGVAAEGAAETAGGVLVLGTPTWLITPPVRMTPTAWLGAHVADDFQTGGEPRPQVSSRPLAMPSSLRSAIMSVPPTSLEYPANSAADRDAAESHRSAIGKVLF
jgi:hypothetical protein